MKRKTLESSMQESQETSKQLDFNMSSKAYEIYTTSVQNSIRASDVSTNYLEKTNRLKFTQKCQLTKHFAAVHEKKKLFEYILCPSKFSQKSNLVLYMRKCLNALCVHANLFLRTI